MKLSAENDLMIRKPTTKRKQMSRQITSHKKGCFSGFLKRKNGSNPQTVATFRRKSHKLAYTIIQTAHPAQGGKRRIQKRIACGAHTSL